MSLECSEKRKREMSVYNNVVGQVCGGLLHLKIVWEYSCNKLHVWPQFVVKGDKHTYAIPVMPLVKNVLGLL